MPGYLTVPDFETQLNKLVTDFPGLCSVESAANKTANGNSVYFVRIADDKVATPKKTVLIIGGVHAREWAPPDALVSFARAFCAAASAKGVKPARYPSLTQTMAPPNELRGSRIRRA